MVGAGLIVSGMIMNSPYRENAENKPDILEKVIKDMERWVSNGTNVLEPANVLAGLYIARSLRNIESSLALISDNIRRSPEKV